MKNGEIITVDHITMILPLVGNIVDVTAPDGEQVRARIVGVNHTGARLKVVPKGTKE